MDPKTGRIVRCPRVVSKQRGQFEIIGGNSKYSRTPMARTPLDPENMFETGVVRASEG